MYSIVRVLKPSSSSFPHMFTQIDIQIGYTHPMYVAPYICTLAPAYVQINNRQIRLDSF